MSKVAVVFWSGTGNTQTMADAVAAGAQGANLAVDSVMANNEPDDDALEACKALGAALA